MHYNTQFNFSTGVIGLERNVLWIGNRISIHPLLNIPKYFPYFPFLDFRTHFTNQDVCNWSNKGYCIKTLIRIKLKLSLILLLVISSCKKKMPIRWFGITCICTIKLCCLYSYPSIMYSVNIFIIVNTKQKLTLQLYMMILSHCIDTQNTIDEKPVGSEKSPETRFYEV